MKLMFFFYIIQEEKSFEEPFVALKTPTKRSNSEIIITKCREILKMGFLVKIF